MLASHATRKRLDDLYEKANVSKPMWAQEPGVDINTTTREAAPRKSVLKPENLLIELIRVTPNVRHYSFDHSRMLPLCVSQPRVRVRQNLILV